MSNRPASKGLVFVLPFQAPGSANGIATNYGPAKRYLAQKVLELDLDVEKVLGGHNDSIFSRRDLELFVKATGGAEGGE